MPRAKTRISSNSLLAMTFKIRSEAPDNSGGGAVVILGRAGVMSMHIVALETPGEILEPQLVIDAAAHVDHQRVVHKAIGVEVPDASHGIDERAPLSEIRRDTRPGHGIVLGYAFAIKAAAIDDQADARKAGERECLERTGPPSIALLVDLIGKLSVRNASVNVSIGKEPIKLC